MSLRLRVMRRAEFNRDSVRPLTAIVLARIPGRVEYAVFTEVDETLRNGYYSRDMERCVAEYESRKRIAASPADAGTEFIFRRYAE